MPEGTHYYLRSTSYFTAMDLPFDSFDTIAEESFSLEPLDKSARAMSVESLNTLLARLPEISIPPTLHNPLPLQCLAASALPDNVRNEIDGVIAQYSNLDGVDPAKPCVESRCAVTEQQDCVSTETEQDGSDAVDKDIETLTAALHKALGIEEATSPSCKKESVPVKQMVIYRETESEESVNDWTFGLKISGGVKCNNCSCLHAIVIEISPNLYGNEDIKEGLCVVEWDGRSLDGCTYEEVQNIVSLTLSDLSVSEVEISVKKCSDNLIIPSCGFDWLPKFAPVRLNKRRNAICQNIEDESGHKQTDSGESSEHTTAPPSPEASRSVSHSREHLDLPLSETTRGRSLPRSLRRSPPSDSRSPSPSEQRKPLEVTIPNMDVTTEALLASMDSMPRSPGHSSLERIMDKMPNGMVQLSLVYNNDYEELSVFLCQAKGQSTKEISDTSDVFINTYLVPDSRQQGVRSIKVQQAKKDGTLKLDEHNSSYIVSNDELDSTALRVILWDAHKSKNIMFRGEVLLGLSDQQIVNLESEPTWFTVCPADPNLPKLPPAVHYKHRHHLGMDNLLQKLKQKAHSLTNNKHPLLKASISTLSLPGSTVEKRSFTLLRKKPRRDTRKTHSGSFAPQFLNMLESEMGSLEADEASRFEKLSSILNVLREDSEAVAENTMLKAQSTDESQKSKLSDILQVLRDDGPTVPKSTDCNDQVDVGDAGMFSTLDRMPRQKEPCSEGKSERSVSTPELPTLSNGTSNFSFLDELEDYIGKQKEDNELGSHLDSAENTVAVKTGAGNSRESEKFHYKLIDSCHSEDELDSPHKYVAGSESNSKSSDFLSYPAEVSLHRINIVDVDKKQEMTKKSATLPSTHVNPRPKTLFPSSGLPDTRPPKPPKKWRSKSVADMEDLDSAGSELLLVRSPFTPSSTPGEIRHAVDIGSTAYLDTGSTDYLDTGSTDYLDTGSTGYLDTGSTDYLDTGSTDHLDTGSTDYLDTVEPLYSHSSDSHLGLSSLDFGNRPEGFERGYLNESIDGVLDAAQSHEEEERVRHKTLAKKDSLFKWKSLENIVVSKPQKSKIRKSRKNSMLTMPNRSSYIKRNSLPENKISSTGNVKLEFQYNDLNPANPVLMVKLTDVVLASPKKLSTDLLLKCYVNHISTGVCVLKDKTLVNLKTKPSSAPLGILQFQTEITNLSAQIFLCGGSRVFSRKIIGQVSVDLNSLNLGQGEVFSQWFQLSKAANF